MNPGSEDQSQHYPRVARWLRRAWSGQRRGAEVLRLGVLSGTFNPPTRAHLALAERAAEQLTLDEVVFVLPEMPPHKEQLEATLEERAELLVAAIRLRPDFSAAIVSHGLFLEIHEALEREYPPGIRMFILVGQDTAERILLRWPYEDSEEALRQMFARFDIVVADRGKAFQLPADSPAARNTSKIHLLQMRGGTAHISATRARERLQRDEPIADLVPPGVEDLIRRRGLYR